MNCDAFTGKLDDYLDGELSSAETRALETHAAGCADCERTLNAARNLQRHAFALPAEREPLRDLWPEIAARIEPRRIMNRQQARWLRGIAAALAVTVVFAGGMLADRVWRENGSDVARIQVDNQPVRNRSLPSLAEARRVLPVSQVELIEGSGSGLQQAAEQDLLRNLLVVNLAIRRVAGAVELDPTNANLRELLADLYTRENRILIEAERLRVEQSSPTRTGI